MPRLIEPLDYTPGLALFTCDTCTSVDTKTLGDRPYCNEFDRRLKSNADGQPLRCAECLVDARGDLND